MSLQRARDCLYDVYIKRHMLLINRVILFRDEIIFSLEELYRSEAGAQMSYILQDLAHKRESS